MDLTLDPAREEFRAEVRDWLRANVPTEPLPHRPFQGWRYLKPDEAPIDRRGGGRSDELPAALVRELRSLGLI